MSKRYIAGIVLGVFGLTMIGIGIFLSVTRETPVFYDYVHVPHANERDDTGNYIEITTRYYVPPLDLRGLHLEHDELEEWFLSQINSRRKDYGIHPYELYVPAVVTSVEHSLDMRDNDFGSLKSSDGRTHQQRHDRWMGRNRTKVTSSHFSTHNVNGELTEERAHDIINTVLGNETSHSFLMNPTYYYIGIGFSIQACGTGRLSITMATVDGEWAAHRARTPEEREIHRQEYLERILADRG